MRSSVGFLRREAPSSATMPCKSPPATSSASMTFCGSAWERYSSSPAPRMMFERVKIVSYSLGGMPIMSQMILRGSRAATSITKSPPPLARISSRISAATRCTSSSIFLSIFGVNAALTILRIRAWRGSSILIIEPKKSFMNSGISAMEVAPLPEQNNAAFLEISRISAYLVTAQ